MENWKKKTLWHRRAKTYCVEVSHHTEEPCSYTKDGPNRWCVYAYIYPAHPIFAEFEGESIFQDAAGKLPLHAGASFLRWHIAKDGKPTSIQVGADYHHDGDDGYTYCDEDEDAYSVFRDANELAEFLESYNARANLTDTAR